MRHEDYLGSRPPCEVCPKLEGVDDKKPLAADDDFGEWFTDLRQFYREGRAMGYGEVDPLMAAVLAEMHDADVSRQQSSLLSAIVLGISVIKNRQ